MSNPYQNNTNQYGILDRTIDPISDHGGRNHEQTPYSSYINEMAGPNQLPPATPTNQLVGITSTIGGESEMGANYPYL